MMKPLPEKCRRGRKLEAIRAKVLLDVLCPLGDDLVGLSVSRLALTDGDVDVLQQHFPTIRWLGLANNKLSNHCLPTVAKFSELWWLGISGNRDIGRDGASGPFKSPAEPPSGA